MDAYLPKNVCSFTGLLLVVAVVVSPPVKPFTYSDPLFLAIRVSFPIDLNARSVGACPRCCLNNSAIESIPMQVNGSSISSFRALAIQRTKAVCLLGRAAAGAGRGQDGHVHRCGAASPARLAGFRARNLHW